MHSSVTAAITNTGSGSYETAVPRSLVHRLAVSEVYLMTAEQLGVDQFHLTAQWPRRHFYYRVADCSVDPMLVAETLRQSTILVAHRYYEVPLTRRFLMRRMTVSLAGGDIVASVRPAEIVLKVGVDRMRSGPNGVTRMRTNIEFWFQDNLIAEGMGDLQVVNARVYERMRSGSQSSEWLTLAAYAGGGKSRQRKELCLTDRVRGRPGNLSSTIRTRFSLITQSTTCPACSSWSRPVRQQRKWSGYRALSSLILMGGTIASLIWVTSRQFGWSVGHQVCLVAAKGSSRSASTKPQR